VLPRAPSGWKILEHRRSLGDTDASRTQETAGTAATLVAVRPRRVRPNPRGRTGGRASQMTHSLAVQSEVEINLSDGLDRPI